MFRGIYFDRQKEHNFSKRTKVAQRKGAAIQLLLTYGF